MQSNKSLKQACLGTMSLGFVLSLAFGAFSSAFAGQNVLICQSDLEDGRQALTVLIEQGGGRLLGHVYDGTRLLKSAGVSERPSGGRYFDVMYLGREFSLSLNSQTYEGKIDFIIRGVRRIAYVYCE